VIAAIHIPFFYSQYAVQRHQIPDTTPIAIERNGHIIDLSPTALLAGASFSHPLRAIRHAVPNLVVLPAESMSTYFNSAENVYAACAEFTPIVEPVQPHLILADLGYEPIQLSRFIAAIGATCSMTLLVGCASMRWVAFCAVNQLLDKLLSQYRQNSTGSINPAVLRANLQPSTDWLEVARGKEHAFLAQLKVDVLSSASLDDPNSVLAKLRSLGITTLGELVQVPITSLTQQFGLETGRMLYKLASGKDRTPVRPLFPPNKITVNYQAPPESEGFCDSSGIDQVLIHLCTELTTLINTRGQAIGRLRLEITTRSGKEYVQKNLKHPTMQRENLLSIARQLYTQKKPNTGVLALSLSSDNLVVPQIIQGDMFADNTGVSDGMLRALHSVHSRFGPQAVQKAGQLPHTRRELVRMLWEGDNL
jgi:nucleotidyltransferase/DNA polymerase involved in DNA repair